MKRSLILLLAAIATLGAGCTQGQKAILQPAKPSNTVTGVATTTPPVVAGMTKYTSDKYGFTFWYPAYLALTSQESRKDLFPGGTVVETMELDPTLGPFIRVVESPSSTIVDKSFYDRVRPVSAFKYFYDSTTNAWMVAYPEDAENGSQYATTTADVSNKTIGGLPMLPSGIRYDAKIIPLSKTRFLVISDGGSATGPALAKTVFLNADGATIDQNLFLQALEAEGVAFREMNASVTNNPQQPVESKQEKPLETFYLNTRHYTVVSSQDFLFNGTTGTVAQACEMPLVHVAMPFEYGYLCMGQNMLYMDLDGKRTIISEFTPNNLGEAKTLFDVGKAGNNILVSFDYNACLYPESLCIQSKEYTYRISLPDRKVHQVNAVIEYMFSFRQFVWNPSGTKGVMAAGCPEGCPAEKYYGMDVLTGKATLLLKQKLQPDGSPIGTDEYIVPSLNDISWKDDKTAIIRGKEYSF